MLIFSGFSHAQSSNLPRIQTPQSIDNYLRLNVEFEVKNNPSPDSTLIRAIPFHTYNRLRNQSEDLEIYDAASDYTIILYSDDKCKLNKQ